MESKKILEIAVHAADSRKAEEIVALDVQKVSLLADYFLIMHANSKRQINAIVEEIIEKEEEAGVKIKRVEGQKSGRWVLIDMGDVVVHVFQTEERAFYNLEKLWADALPVKLEF
ncbi:MAG: ribosome silencing factor [Lactobacillales bacterium]|nr:ribosome silencing factor [Lactobacillales bacterium]